MTETGATAAANGSDSGDIVAKLRARLVEHSCPLWSTEGWDQSTGGFIDRLTPDGRADRLAPRRVFVQARQIYCFAKAAEIGWDPPRRESALQALEAPPN